MTDFNINFAPVKLEYVPAILAFILVCGLFGILFVLLYHPVPPENKDAFNIVFGAVSGSVGTAVAFYFGSSKSNQAKDETIKTIAASAVNNNNSSSV